MKEAPPVAGAVPEASIATQFVDAAAPVA
jgi:hypothetical protein